MVTTTGRSEAIPSGVNSSQIADERQRSARHHHDAVANRHEQEFTSSRSVSSEPRPVTIEPVAQHLQRQLEALGYTVTLDKPDPAEVEQTA